MTLRTAVIVGNPKPGSRMLAGARNRWVVDVALSRTGTGDAALPRRLA